MDPEAKQPDTAEVQKLAAAIAGAAIGKMVVEMGSAGYQMAEPDELAEASIETARAILAKTTPEK